MKASKNTAIGLLISLAAISGCQTSQGPFKGHGGRSAITANSAAQYGLIQSSSSGQQERAGTKKQNRFGALTQLATASQEETPSRKSPSKETLEKSFHQAAPLTRMARATTTTLKQNSASTTAEQKIVGEVRSNDSLIKKASYQDDGNDAQLELGAPGKTARGQSQDRTTENYNVAQDNVPAFVDSTVESPLTPLSGGSSNSLLQEIEHLVLSINPAVLEAQAKIDALSGKFTQAGLSPNPTAGIIGSNINEDGGGGQYGVYYGQEIVRGNKLGLSQAVVCAEIETAQQNLAIVQQKLLTDVQRRYYELLVAQEKVDVTQELEKISRQAVDVSEKLFAAEEVARTAVLQSELELQNTLVVKRQAHNELRAARRKLAALTAESDLIYDRVEGDPRTMTPLDDFETSFDTLIANSPEMSALYADVEVAQRNLSRQRAQPISNMTWQASLAYDIPSDDVVGGFQLGWPIPTLDRNQGAICQAQQEIVQAQRKAEKRILDLRQRLATAYEGYVEAKLQMDAFDLEILPKAKETYELISKGYQEGEVNFLELLTAQRTYSQTVLSYLEKLQQAWQQNVQIRGMLLSGSLE